MGLFSFITAPFAAVGTAIGKVVSAGKVKAAATINAANAAKQRAHELKMANLAATAAQAQGIASKKTQTMILAGGGLALVAFFILRKKR